MAQTVASGMRVWYHWLGGQTGLGKIIAGGRQERNFQWQARHDPISPTRNLSPISALSGPTAECLLHSARTNTPRGRGAAEFMQGLYAVLIEGRFFFDFRARG